MVCGFQATMAGKNFFLHFTMLLLLMIILTWCTRFPESRTSFSLRTFRTEMMTIFFFVILRMGITFECLETLEGIFAMLSLVRGHSWETEIRERSLKMINVIIKKKL